MTARISFDANTLLKNLEFDSNANNWTFFFDDGNFLNASGFWRLLKEGKIIFVSLDHGHQFGLMKPFDLAETVKQELDNQQMTRIAIRESTGDLLLSFNDDITLEIFISSSSYETYNFSFDGKTYIGLGSGETAVF